MIATTETGQLIVYLTEDAVDEAAIAAALETFETFETFETSVKLDDSDRPVVLDSSKTRIQDLEKVLGWRCRNILICNLLDAFYQTTIPTREAAQILGRVKSRLEWLVDQGAHIVVLCRRRSESHLGTRAHFNASLCASADQVYFRSNT